MRVNRNGAPDNFVIPRIQRWKRYRQQRRIGFIRLHITLINLVIGNIEYLNLAERRFQFLGRPDLDLPHCAHFTTHPGFGVVGECVCPTCGRYRHQEENGKAGFDVIASFSS
jgi:hypothetical protein